METSIAAEHPRSVRGPAETQRLILFPRKAAAKAKDRRDALNIAHRLNMSLSVAKVPTHICIHKRNCNEKGNLSGLMAPASTSSLLLPQHRELVLKVVW